MGLHCYFSKAEFEKYINGKCSTAISCKVLNCQYYDTQGLFHSDVLFDIHLEIPLDEIVEVQEDGDHFDYIIKRIARSLKD